METKTKHQKFREGSFVEIEISKNRKVFGRLLPSFRFCVYDYLVTNEKIFDLEDVISEAPLFYLSLYKKVVTGGYFRIVGYRMLSETELKQIPPSFMQSEPNIEKCVLGYYDGRDEIVDPVACIGLERASVYDDQNVIKRIEDHYAGIKNFSVELNKVILTRDDPRYMNPNVKWSFEKEEFYK